MSEKITLETLREYKAQGRRIAMLTCYDYATAVLMQRAGVESILVGDTLAELVLGRPNTLSAEMDIMVALTAAVRRGAPKVYLVGDMPFLSYQVDQGEAMRNAGRFLTEGGCDIVKLEVDERYTDLIATLNRAGIPVMGHIGLRPQRIHQMGRLRAQGRDAVGGMRLLEEAMRLVEAGVSALLLECVAGQVAEEITKRVGVPVISCGSGQGCDGQVLVLHDVLNLPGAGEARFAKCYAEVGKAMQGAFEGYVRDIHEKSFPDDQHSYGMAEGEDEVFEKMLAEREKDTGRD